MPEGFTHTEWSHRAVNACQRDWWTREDFATFCERAGRTAETKPQLIADWEAWFETENDVIDRRKNEQKNL